MLEVRRKAHSFHRIPFPLLSPPLNVYDLQISPQANTAVSCSPHPETAVPLSGYCNSFLSPHLCAHSVAQPCFKTTLKKQTIYLFICVRARAHRHSDSHVKARGQSAGDSFLLPGGYWDRPLVVGLGQQAPFPAELMSPPFYSTGQVLSSRQ